MKNHTLSLLIGAALTIPSLAMAAPVETTPVDMQNTATATTLETEIGNADNELATNQSSPYEINETQSVSRANVNANANQQPKAILLEQEAVQDSQEAMLLEQEAMLDSEEDLQPAP